MEALNVEKKEPEGLKGKMIAKIKLPIPININNLQIRSNKLPDPSKTAPAPENLESMIINETAKTEMLANQLNNLTSNTLNTGDILSHPVCWHFECLTLTISGVL